jgi:hypothetical protein
LFDFFWALVYQLPHIIPDGLPHSKLRGIRPNTD